MTWSQPSDLVSSGSADSVRFAFENTGKVKPSLCIID